MKEIISYHDYAHFSTTSKTIFITRLLSKLGPADTVQGVSGTENRSVHEVREDLSTGTTKQCAGGVEFRKKSTIDNFDKRLDLPCQFCVQRKHKTS